MPLRSVCGLPRGWSLFVETDNGEPRLKDPGGVVFRPDQLRNRLERHFLQPAIQFEEDTRTARGECNGFDLGFCALRKARLWLEWDPERRTWDEQYQYTEEERRRLREVAA